MKTLIRSLYVATKLQVILHPLEEYWLDQVIAQSAAFDEQPSHRNHRLFLHCVARFNEIQRAIDDTMNLLN